MRAFIAFRSQGPAFRRVKRHRRALGGDHGFVSMCPRDGQAILV